MPNIPGQENQQPESQEQRKRQQLNDKSLQGNDREKASDAGRKRRATIGPRYRHDIRAHEQASPQERGSGIRRRT